MVKQQMTASSLVLGNNLQILIFTGLLFNTLICFDFSMTPKNDIFILVGSDLQLNCTAEQGIENFNLHNLSISMIGETFPPEMFTYYPSQLTTQLTIPNVTVDDAGSYMCAYNTKYQIYTLKIVNIGLPPDKPEKITCISYNFTNMVCWVHLGAVKTNIPINWTMQFKKGSDVNETVICKKPDLSTNTINGSLNTENFRLYEKYEIEVIGKSSTYQFKVSRSFEVFTNESIVKPLPLDVTYNYTNESTKVMIGWTLANYLICYRFNFIFKITLKSQDDWDDRSLSIEPNCTEKFEFQLDVIPYANYTVTVQARPVEAVSDIYWSDAAAVHFQTNSAAPARSTSLTEGSFYMLNSSVTEYCLVLYWRNTARRYRYGVIKKYKVYILPKNIVATQNTTSAPSVPFTQNSISHGGSVTAGFNDSGAVTETINDYDVFSVLPTKLKKTEEYVVKMRMANEVGYSQNVSEEIIIPTWQEGLEYSVSFVTVEVGVGGVKVSWEVKGDYCANITEATYYWCSNKHDNSRNTTYVRCKNELSWLSNTVQGACEGGDIRLNITENPSELRVAVSIVVNGKSGGMVWEAFRFNNIGAVPEMPLYRLESDPSNMTLVHVTVLYNEDYYISGAGRPEEYIVVYKEAQVPDITPVCPTDGLYVSFPVNFVDPVMKLSRLEPGTQYLICVGSVNAVGASKYGEPQYVNTTSETVLADEQTPIEVIVIVSSLATIGLIVFFVGWKYQCRQKFNEYILENKVENSDLDNRLEKCIKEQIAIEKPPEHDSGTGTDSNPSSVIEWNGPSSRMDSEYFIIDMDTDQECTPILSHKPSLVSKTSTSSSLSGYLNVGGTSDGTLTLVNVCQQENERSHLIKEGSDPELPETNDSFVFPGEDQSSYKWKKKPKVNSEIQPNLPVIEPENGMEAVFHISGSKPETRVSATDLPTQVPTLPPFTTITNDPSEFHVLNDYVAAENTDAIPSVSDAAENVIGSGKVFTSEGSCAAVDGNETAVMDTDAAENVIGSGKVFTSEGSCAAVDDNETAVMDIDKYADEMTSESSLSGSYLNISDKICNTSLHSNRRTKEDVDGPQLDLSDAEDDPRYDHDTSLDSYYDPDSLSNGEDASIGELDTSSVNSFDAVADKTVKATEENLIEKDSGIEYSCNQINSLVKSGKKLPEIHEENNQAFSTEMKETCLKREMKLANEVNKFGKGSVVTSAGSVGNGGSGSSGVTSYVTAVVQ